VAQWRSNQSVGDQEGRKGFDMTATVEQPSL